ncbi:MAG: hypothetical protein Q7V01_06330 [Vicinamibacterales bacterium]|nr:hypothetical protein [Vicinamibacterales bacterium]
MTVPPPRAPRLTIPQGVVAMACRVVAAVFLCLTPAAVCAQEAGGLTSLDVPGGIAAFARVLGADPDAPRASLMLTAVRLMWEAPDGVDAGADRRRADGLAYLGMLAAIERARGAAAGVPVTLATLVGRLGPADAGVLAGAFGCHLEDQGGGRWRLRPSDSPAVRRRGGWLADAGVDVDALAAGLNAGSAMALTWPSDSVPLVLSRDTWTRLLKPAPAFAGSVFTSLLSDRRGSFIYHGAAALDGPTRAFIENGPPALLDDRRSPVFAHLGRSVRVAGGRVAVPGGADAEPLWEAVVGGRVADAIAFVPKLLDRDGGRLALLYDGIGHAAPDVRRFVLGSDQPDVAARVARFKDLVAAAERCLVGWNPRARPFERVAFDVSHLLARLRMTPDGRRPAGPSSARFWAEAFGGTGVTVEPGAARRMAAGERLDAPGLVGLLCVPSTSDRRLRAETWLFIQRVFPEPADADLDDVLVALRGFQRFPALVLTLERIGIADPATYARVVAVADGISRAQGSHAWTAVAQFQSAISIVERARFHRAFDAATADAWLRRLAAVSLSHEREYFGALAAWLDDLLASAVPAASSLPEFPDPDRLLETRLAALMAGAVERSPSGDTFRTQEVEWEGLRYRVDPAAATLRRTMDVRARQGGPSLDAVMAVMQAVRAIENMGELTNLASRIASLSNAVAALEAEAPADGGLTGQGQPDLGRAWADVERQLRTVRRAISPAGMAGVLRPLTRAADWYLAHVLVSLAYAPHLGEPDSPALLGGDPSRRHDFGLDDSRLDRRIETMWRLPVAGRDSRQQWLVSGALLGLDVALGRFALRRVPSELMPSPPMLTDVERQAFTEAVVLVSPFDFTDDARAALLDALAAGRARRAAASPATIAAHAAGAGLDEWRTAMLPWVLVHEPPRAEGLWSLAELVVLGLSGQPRLPGLDAWGGSGLSLDGSLTTVFPWVQPWATLSGRKGTRLVPALAADLGIALAESLAGLGLPARLSGGVLAVATQAFLDTIRTNHEDDWMTLVVNARRTTAGGVEDFVSALTIGGALTPADRESEHEHDR